MNRLILLTLPLVALLASCSSTPTSRIEKHPEIYSQLSSKNQNLVSQGKIAKGMSQPAVFLAMGSPDHRVHANKDGKEFERWAYNILTPVYHGSYSSFHGGFGHGRFGRRERFGRRGGFGHGGFGYGTSVSYAPRVGSSVEFVNNKVTGWTTIQRGPYAR